jgi:hypothetical protein
MLDMSDQIIWMEDGKVMKVAERDEVEIEVDVFEER